jgi:hypothetical protein
MFFYDEHESVHHLLFDFVVEICDVASIAYKKDPVLLEYLKSSRRENNVAQHDRLLYLQFE